MSGYQGKASIVSVGNYANQVYETKSDFGTPPPTPPLRFLLQENGFFLLQENGFRIEIEIGTPYIRYILQENGKYLLQENGKLIEIDE